MLGDPLRDSHCPDLGGHSSHVCEAGFAQVLFGLRVIHVEYALGGHLCALFGDPIALGPQMAGYPADCDLFSASEQPFAGLYGGDGDPLSGACVIRSRSGDSSCR